MGKVLAGLILLTVLIVAVVSLGFRKRLIDPRLAARYAGFCDKML